MQIIDIIETPFFKGVIEGMNEENKNKCDKLFKEHNMNININDIIHYAQRNKC